MRLSLFGVQLCVLAVLTPDWSVMADTVS